MALTEEQLNKLKALAGGAAATGLGAYSYSQLSGQGGLLNKYAQYSDNFLKGHYTKGTLDKVTGLPVRKVTNFGKEWSRATGRLGKSFFSPIHSVTQSQTGISRNAYNLYNNAQNQINMIIQDYIENDVIKPQFAQQKIRNLEKQVHHKLVNDYSNNWLFGTKRKGAITEYGSQFVKRAYHKDFIRIMGGEGNAGYIANQWPGIGRDFKTFAPLRFLEYKNVPWADTIRGAQFDKKFYNIMQVLKENGKNPNMLFEMLQSEFPEIKPEMTSYTKNGKTHFKIRFNTPPSIRPNYDWGGYNAVGMWDSRKIDKIAIATSDMRDVPGYRGKFPVINFSAPKEITIVDAAKKVIEPPKVAETVSEEYVRGPNKKGLTPEEFMNKKIEKAKKFKTGGMSPVFDESQNKVFSRYTNNYQRNFNIARKSLSNSYKWNTIAPVAKSFAKRGGALGALILGGLTIADYLD